jgi:hypothetical protein
MASDVPNRFDRDDLSVELDFVATFGLPH